MFTYQLIDNATAQIVVDEKSESVFDVDVLTKFEKIVGKDKFGYTILIKDRRSVISRYSL